MVEQAGLHQAYENRWASSGEGPETYTDAHFTNMIYCATGLENADGPMRVLDWMSGPGKVGMALQELSGGRHSIFFLDRSETATAKLADAGMNAVRAEASMIPFPAESMDLVVARYAVKDLPAGQQPDALKEAYRVLRPGGKLVVADMITAKGDTERWINGQHLLKQRMSGRRVETEGECNLPTEEKWVDLMREAGFSVNSEAQQYVSKVNTNDWVPAQINPKQREEMDGYILNAKNDDRVRTLYNIRSEDDGVHIDFPVRIFSAVKAN